MNTRFSDLLGIDATKPLEEYARDGSEYPAGTRSAAGSHGQGPQALEGIRLQGLT